MVDFGISRVEDVPGFAMGSRSEWCCRAPGSARDEPPHNDEINWPLIDCSPSSSRDDEITWKINDFNPVSTEGWRWIACELMVDNPDEHRDWISRVTMATDVWSFAMTVVEVRICIYSVLLMLSIMPFF